MSNRTFVAGLVVCLAIMLAIGGVIAILNAGNNRPEGVAERWLTAVGDTTRKGVEVDARNRAEKIGALSNAQGLISDDTDGKSAFPDLEVGKAFDANGTWMRFRLHSRHGDDTKEVNGAIALTKADSDEWHVAQVLVEPDPNNQASIDRLPKLPSDGGPPPSSAPWSLWIGGLVGAAVIGVITTTLIRLASRGAAAPFAAV